MGNTGRNNSVWAKHGKQLQMGIQIVTQCDVGGEDGLQVEKQGLYRERSGEI